MKKDEVVWDTSTTRYALIVEAGAYFSDTLLGVLWEMLKHRFHHLRKHGIWMD